MLHSELEQNYQSLFQNQTLKNREPKFQKKTCGEALLATENLSNMNKKTKNCEPKVSKNKKTEKHQKGLKMWRKLKRNQQPIFSKASKNQKKNAPSLSTLPPQTPQVFRSRHEMVAMKRQQVQRGTPWRPRQRMEKANEEAWSVDFYDFFRGPVVFLREEKVGGVWGEVKPMKKPTKLSGS